MRPIVRSLCGFGFGIVTSILPSMAWSDAQFVQLEDSEVLGRVAINTPALSAGPAGALFFDKYPDRTDALFLTYFFQVDPACAPVTGLALVDDDVARWVPELEKRDIEGTPILMVRTVDELIEALFDANTLEVALVNSCHQRIVYRFDLKGYARAMKKLGYE